MAIVIIADDLSSAAELAGIAFARELSAEVQREFDPSSRAALIAVDTNSRSLSPATAAQRVAEIARAVVASRPDWIFKKTDSVLRGNVRAEIEAILSVTGQRRATLLPANPSRGRTIAGGQYFIDGVPLDQTEFARDPEHPRQTALLAELLGTELLGTGATSDIATPDATSLDDLRAQVRQLDDATLAAGAADYFTALLESRTASLPKSSLPVADVHLQFPVLLLCGSRAAWPRRCAECAAAQVPIHTCLPAAGRLAIADRMLVGVGDAEFAESSSEPVSRLAELTASLLKQTPVATVLAEGGATAAAVADRLAWRRLAVAARAPAGVGVLQPLTKEATTPRLLIKPGSYDWPAPIWQQFLKGRPDGWVAQSGQGSRSR
jgi:uncharacterized protein YgbK (DUF1537 family)